MNLKIKIENLTRQNSDLAKQLAECKVKFDEKIIECGYLQEENDELHTLNIQLEKSHEKNLQVFFIMFIQIFIFCLIIIFFLASSGENSRTTKFHF